MITKNLWVCKLYQFIERDGRISRKKKEKEDFHHGGAVKFSILFATAETALTMIGYAKYHKSEACLKNFSL